ncbi:hypothetical protein [Peribacillus saganii]|nr:hypothetical protein [Peribacillus saganii]
MRQTSQDWTLGTIGDLPDFEEKPEEYAPGMDRDDYERILKRLMSNL